MNSDHHKINFYPTLGGYIAKFTIPEIKNKSKAQCETIVILDKSGSMGQNVPRIYNKILPDVFEKLGYDAKYKIKVIMFDDNIETTELGTDEMRKKNVYSGDTTHMSEAVIYLEILLKRLNVHNFRILTISDGELHDQTLTVESASKLAKSINNKYNINSQAVRFFTSRQQPDTRGLASILQLNTNKKTNLVDIKDTLDNQTIVNQIVKLFESDGWDKSIKLVSKDKVIMSTPWNLSSDYSFLSTGENTIWFKDIPTDLSIEDTEIKFDIDICDTTSENDFDNLIKPKLEYLLDKLKILKVVNTIEAQAEIKQIVEYFSELQKWTNTKNTDTVKLLNNCSLRGRIQYYKNVLEKRKKGIVQLMLQIANDDRVSKLNSAQQADYLRTLDSNKNTKALSRRAIDLGIDFTDVLHKEIKEMHSHLYELSEISDENHLCSFYSQDTTLAGIKMVCSLVDDKMLEELTAPEILQMINIVGVAVNAEIGDYPDPMSWRVKHIFLGSYISMSDIMMAHIQSNGKKLHPPGQEVNNYNEITAVIPLFDDLRIAKFLKKYAPSLMEYNASIGMRRIIAGVRMTNGYSMVAGILKLVEEINQTPSTINIQTFVSMVKTYDVIVDGYFDHVLPYIKEQDPDLTFYIGNNGLTNMIHPLYKLVTNKNTKFIPQILRSIYSYETYQIIKRIVKKESNQKNEYINECLFQLLGIDLAKYSTPITNLFEPNPKPTHHEQYYPNEQFANQLSFAFSETDNLVLLPAMLAAVNDNDPIGKIQAIPKLSNLTIAEELGINYDVKLFKFYALLQALFYPSKKARVDETKESMKVPDLAKPINIEKMLKEFVSKQYADNYMSRVVIKAQTEKKILKDELVNKLINCPTTEEFCNLMKTGHSYKNINHIIMNNCSLGYIELENGLLGSSENIPKQLDKIIIFLTGKDLNDEIVWNSGNLLRIKFRNYKWLHDKFDGVDSFEKLTKLYEMRQTHIYRDKLPNRHSHSNDKVSYWGYGWQTLEDMINDISNEEWLEYKKIHYNCCGIDKL